MEFYENGRIFRVSFDLSLPLENRIKREQYEYVDPNINAENFPSVGTGQQERELKLLMVDGKRHTYAGIQYATLDDLVAFRNAYPEIPSEGNLYAFGSGLYGIWPEPDEELFPVIRFYYSSSERNPPTLSLKEHGYNGDWILVYA